MKKENDIPASERQIARIRSLGEHIPGVSGFAGGRPAAVMIPLVETGHTLQVLFELRAPDLDIQPGEICFPGGGLEPGEEPEAAAVRETAEELCIQNDQITVLAGLDAVIGPSGAPIWAFAGQISGYEGTWSADEVAETFTVPLDWLLQNEPKVYMTELVTVTGDDFPYDLVPGGKEYPWARKKNPVYFYCWKDKVIWGLTARILTEFLRKLKA